MKNYQITISGGDVPYILEAIGLRAISLQQSIRMQIEEVEARARQAEQPKTITISSDPIAIPEKTKEEPNVKTVSRKSKRAALMRVLRSKNATDLSTAEIARRAGVSYVTAMKARHAFAKPAKKGKK